MDIRPLIRKALPARLKRLASRVGHSFNVELFLLDLSTLGVSPQNIIDIGAADGDLTELMVRHFPRVNSVTMVEPREDRAAHLRWRFPGKRFSVVNSLIAKEDGRELRFFVRGNASSIHDIGNADTQMVRARRLDAILPRERFRSALVKIDVQGAEAEVLESMGDSLELVDALIIEVSTVAVYDGAPLLSDVVAYMSEKGFFVYSVGHMHRNRYDVAIQLDLCFLSRRYTNLQTLRSF